MPRLVVQDPSGVAISLAVEHGARVGRDDGCEVLLADGKVSRHHATVEREGDAWYVADVAMDVVYTYLDPRIVFVRSKP